MISRMLALVVALVAVLLLAVAGPGTRAGLWQFTTGLQMLRWAAYAGLAGVVLALAALALSRTRGQRGSLAVPLVALVLAGIAVGVPWSFMQRARGVPQRQHHELRGTGEDQRAHQHAFAGAQARLAGQRAPHQAEGGHAQGQGQAAAHAVVEVGAGIGRRVKGGHAAMLARRVRAGL